MDSPLAALARKGNLSHALSLYNPLGAAEKVVHFSPSPEDLPLAAELAVARIEVYPYFHPRSRSRLLGALAGLVRVCGKLRRERVNVIRARLPYLGGLLGSLAGRILGIPAVISLGGDNRLAQQLQGRYYFGSRRVSYAVEHLALWLCDAIIAPNRFTRDYVAGILGRAAADRKVHVIPWAVERRTPRPLSGIERDLPLAVVVGHLNPYKLSEVMFEVAARLEGKVRFVFCGDGPLRAQGESRLPHARFLGWQPNQVVTDLLAAADVVLVPMSGFVLLEAAALGRAVVAANLEWHPEMVEHGQTGLLVEPGQAAAWAEQVLRLVDDPELRGRLGESLRARFEADYAPEKSLERELQLYRRLLAR